MFALAVAALRDDMRMLAEQENVFDGARFARGDDAFLQRVRFGVTDETEIYRETVAHFATR
jgi:hypothetical protein